MKWQVVFICVSDEAWEKGICSFDGVWKRCCPFSGVSGWRIAVFVACVEHVCADEVCDCGLCTVSVDGTDGLSVEKSCGYSACCSAVFGGSLFHVVGYICAGANGLSKEFASFR
jgi:hypothetical protein